MRHTRQEVIERTIREYELLAALEAVPDEWFSGSERNPDWLYDLEGHSAVHRERDNNLTLSNQSN